MRIIKGFINLCIIILLLACKSENTEVNDESVIIPEKSYNETYRPYQTYKSDGIYCAYVKYYNPSTGTKSIYTLNVEVENNQLIIIYFPNGGWLDSSHFQPKDISDGNCTFKSDKGYWFTVKLQKFGRCHNLNDYNNSNGNYNEVEQFCSRCGGNKNIYDEFCNECENENVCPRCEGNKNIHDELCHDCKKETELSCNKCGKIKFTNYSKYCDDCNEYFLND
jgi:hypothetical protein